MPPLVELLLMMVMMMMMMRHAAQTQAGILACSRDDVALPCSGHAVDSADFVSVTWYQVVHTSQLHKQEKSGIIRMSKGEDAPKPFKDSRPATMTGNFSLVLPRVTPEDSATYKCVVSADIGGQNLNFQVNLTVHECVTPAEPTMAPTTSSVNGSDPTSSPPPPPLPVTWSVGGSVAVGVLKIVSSLIVIWVIRTTSSK